jgi:mRNA-degrading endonuclease RelE of RelBE toxin-antitoxin system
MADEITKFLARVTKSERAFLLRLIDSILDNTVSPQNVTKLVGSKDIYRLKKGVFRIIYQVTKNDRKILSVSNRNEKTYKVF